MERGFPNWSQIFRSFEEHSRDYVTKRSEKYGPSGEVAARLVSAARTPSPAQRKRLKVYVDEVKERHTSHWDLDSMSQAEFDHIMRHGLPDTRRPARIRIRNSLGVVAFGIFLCFLPTLYHWLKGVLGLH